MVCQKNVPKLRFKGFTEEWGRRNVSDVAEIVAGGTPSTKIAEYWAPKEIPWLSSGEVHKKYITFTDKMISKVGMDNSSAKMVKKNSVLIALAGQGKTRGTVAINRIPLTTNQSIAAMTFIDDIVPEFVFSNLEIRYDELRKMSSGDGARGGLNKKIVGDIEIPYTSKTEQQKIGTFFYGLDSIIALHQRKCDKLKEYKKGCLQKMFPRGYADVPEVRFPGFTGAWERKKFGEVFEGLQNNTLSRAELNIDGGEVKNVHYGDVLIKFGDYIDASRDELPYITNNEITKRYSASFLRDGDIIIADTAEDETVGKCSEIVGSYGMKILSGLHTIPCRPRQKYAPKFLGYYINSAAYHSQLIPLMHEGKVNSISKSELKHTDLILPKSYDEQAKIGEYFSNLDNLITLHQCEYEKYKELKKGLLQQMFV